MKFHFMAQKGTFDDVFILRMLIKEYRAKGNCISFVDLEKMFDRVPMEVLE